jgi:hypothetical protein
MYNDQTNTGKIKRKFLSGLFFIAALFLLSLAVLFLWNAILPGITHLSNISYWQALGLLALCRVLFGNFRFSIWDRHHKVGSSWFLKDKLMNMDETDRKAFKEEWRKRYEQRKDNLDR